MYIRINGILYLSFSCLFFASCKGQFLPGLLLRRECGGIDDSGDSEHSVPRSFQEPRGKLGGATRGGNDFSFSVQMAGSIEACSNHYEQLIRVNCHYIE